MQNTYIDNSAHKLLHTFEKIDAINPTFERIYLVCCHHLLNTSNLPANSSCVHSYVGLCVPMCRSTYVYMSGTYACMLYACMYAICLPTCMCMSRICMSFMLYRACIRVHVTTKVSSYQLKQWTKKLIKPPELPTKYPGPCR